jgi:hypothetical protein
MPPVCDLDNQSIGGKRSKLSRMIGGNSWWRTKGGGGFWPLSATGFLSTHRDSATLTPPPRCPNLPHGQESRRDISHRVTETPSCQKRNLPRWGERPREPVFADGHHQQPDGSRGRSPHQQTFQAIFPPRHPRRLLRRQSGIASQFQIRAIIRKPCTTVKIAHGCQTGHNRTTPFCLH